MKEIKFFMDEHMFIGNVLLFLCYIQSNLLMFRLLFISACLFFLIFSLTRPIISIDLVIFNILFTLINILLSIPLIKNLVPPNFTQEQKDIYKNHFKNYLTPLELSVLLLHHRRKIYRVTTSVIQLGNQFSSLFFVAKIGKNCRIQIRTRKRKFDLQEYSWLGVPEYLTLISKKDALSNALREFDTGQWGVTMKVFIEADNSSVYDGHSLQFLKDDKSEIKIDTTEFFLSKEGFCDDNIVILYEFDLKEIDKIFSDNTYGESVMRGLHSIWLKYCSDLVKKVDQTSVANFTAISIQMPSPSKKTIDESNRNIKLIT